MNEPTDNQNHAARHGVEIVVRHDGLVIWINVDGICVSRVITNGFIPITIQDDRQDLKIKINEGR